MKPTEEPIAELRTLIAEVREGEPTPLQAARLQQMVAESPTARRTYARYSALQAMLELVIPGIEADRPATLPSDISTARLSSTIDAEQDDAPAPPTFAPMLPVFPPIITVAGSRRDADDGFFSSDWPMAYLTSAVICGIGILILALIPVHHYVQFARQSVDRPSGVVSGAGSAGQGDAEESASDKADEPLDSSFPPLIGQITGMVDCQWSDPQTEASNGASVPLGRKYALSSGLMQITYDSGAKVILQGPCTYEVESPAGGYLSVGKLTAKVEKGPMSKAQGSISAEVEKGSMSKVQGSVSAKLKSQIPNPKSQIAGTSPPSTLPSPLFTIKTPTATVTDLGTEFGVEVSEEGPTTVHVMQGIVEARCVGQSNVDQPTRLLQGEAVQIGQNGKSMTTTTFAPQSFARTLQQQINSAAEDAYIKAVLADKPLGYWPLNAPLRASSFSDLSGNGFRGYSMGKIETGAPGPLGDNSHSAAFDGRGYIDLGRHDVFAMETDFTVEAWLWPENPLLHSTVFSAIGRDGNEPFGWVFSQYHDASDGPIGMRLTLPQWTNPIKDTAFGLDAATLPQTEWTHAALTFDRDWFVHLFVNGRCAASQRRDNTVQVGPVWFCIGYADLGDQYYWRGRLAHVAVYAKALSAEQILNHYTRRSDDASDGRR